MIHLEAWYREASFLSKIRGIFDNWGVPSKGIKFKRETPVIINIGISPENKKKLRNNLGNIQRDLSEFGWRITLWRQDYSEEENISLTVTNEVPAMVRAPVYYHVTLLRNWPSIQKQGLLPFKNYEYIKNPRPAVYLASSLEYAKNSMPVRSGSKLVLEVRVPSNVPLYPDPEVSHMTDLLKGSIVYSLHRIPSGLITPQLKGSNFGQEDMHGWEIAGQDVSESSFIACDFSRMDLSGVKFIKTTLKYSNMIGVDLHGSDLEYSSFEGVSLQGANLRGCDLRGADLSEADLRGADLTGAILDGALVPGINLRDAIYDKEQLYHTRQNRWA